MQVSMLSLQHVFEKDVLHEVPLYQRPYVWSEAEQWVPLWEDVRRLAELLECGGKPRAHFLGATVQDKIEVPPGHIEKRLLIDGQQRLTTLQILLKALHDVSREHDTKYAAAIAKLIRNNHPLNTQIFESFKVWPTNADRQDFQRVMEAVSRPDLAKEYGAGGAATTVGKPIADAYMYFTSEIEGWLAETPEPSLRIAHLYGAVRDNVRMVVIDLDDKDDAQLIFETLNARGTPLLAADLIKNALLSEISVPERESAYLKYWQGFDHDSTFWRERVGRGHAQRARIETFLQHTLTILSDEEVSSAHLYTSYRDYVDGAHDGGALDRMKTIHRFGEIYKKLVTGHEHARIALFLERLETMQFESAYPFLLKLFDRAGDEDSSLLSVIIDLESFLVRRLVARLSTRGYNRLFVDLLSELDGEVETIPAAVRAKLLSGTAEVDRWPDHAEFYKAWTQNPLYENLTRPRLRMLLEGVEMGLRNDLADTQLVPRNLTVEHVLPQSWHTHWPLPVGKAPAEASAERDALVHTIGNLTLLNKKLNPTQSNYSWISKDEGVPSKRDGMQENCTLFLNKAIWKEEDWSEQSIRARADVTFQVAEEIWPRPASVS